MKKMILIAFCFLMIQVDHAQVPFHRGVNLTGWFQASSARKIQFRKFTKKDFIEIKSLGCDVIRLPINLHGMTAGAPDYVIDPLLFTFLDSAVNWAEELQLYLLIDNHSFDPSANTSPDIGSKWGKYRSYVVQYADGTPLCLIPVTFSALQFTEIIYLQPGGQPVDSLKPGTDPIKYQLYLTILCFKDCSTGYK